MGVIKKEPVQVGDRAASYAAKSVTQGSLIRGPPRRPRVVPGVAVTQYRWRTGLPVGAQPRKGSSEIPTSLRSARVKVLIWL